MLHIWPEELSRNGPSITTSVTIEQPDCTRQTLWYSLPEEHFSSLHPTCDPFVVGSIYLLMQAGHSVQVHGQVSPSLLQNLDEYMAARTLWRTELSRVEIRADLEKEPAPGQKGHEAVVAYSGGVDSSFTVYRHSRGKVRVPRRVVNGVMVRGFDIPLADGEEFLRALERSRRMLQSLGLGLIPMATNYRIIVPDHDYSHSWGAAVASCLMVLGGRFSTALLSQSVAFDDLLDLDWGCNPLADHLMSSASFEVIPDGAEVSRIGKISVLNEWEEFRQYARVCWQAPERDRNCCSCEKCIRTILGFRVLGLPLPPCFEEDVSIEQILAMDHLTDKAMATWYDSLLEIASRRGVDEPWTRALAERLRRNRKMRRSRIRRYLRRAFGLLRRLGRMAKEMPLARRQVAL
jgi:hypothetical protein